MESFVVLAGERHYGRAASRLSMSTSALSKRISRLEKSVGTQLVERDTGGFVDLTRSGDRFLARCDPLLRAVRDARRDALQASESAVLRVGIPGAPTDHFPPQAWRMVSLGLKQLVPGCRLELRDVPYGRVAQSLLSGWIDVLLSSSLVGSPLVNRFDLVAEQIGVSGRVLHVPPGHELDGALTTTVAEIADFAFVREPTAPDYWMAPWLLGDLRGPKEIRAVDVPGRRIGDIDRAVHQRVAAGVFSAITPLSFPDLIVIPIKDAPLVPFYAVRRRQDDRDAVLGLLQTLRVLSAAFAVNHSATRSQPSMQDLNAWWVAWTIASAGDPSALGTLPRA
ncbi:LysR family transcriptional regulator [Arthrobacter globiformis]|uniref:LysR family transcriptional regulator n=1 Tax=Arthrobacter globiformis TaxID=1665 RepID=UPI00397DB460